MENTHIESGEWIYDFTHEVLVECPKCHAMAVARRPKDAANRREAWLQSLACTSCGYQIRTVPDEKGTVFYESGLGLPLWLSISCCGNELWAYNRDHLEYLESFIRADQRKRGPEEVSSLRNRRLESRLPKWMKSSKNRDAVLKGIERLKKKLPPKQD